MSFLISSNDAVAILFTSLGSCCTARRAHIAISARRLPSFDDFDCRKHNGIEIVTGTLGLKFGPYSAAGTQHAGRRRVAYAIDSAEHGGVHVWYIFASRRRLVNLRGLIHIGCIAKIWWFPGLLCVEDFLPNFLMNNFLNSGGRMKWDHTLIRKSMSFFHFENPDFLSFSIFHPNYCQCLHRKYKHSQIALSMISK